MQTPVSSGTLFLIPNTLGSESLRDVIPAGVLDKINHLQYFIAENEKEARRLLKLAGIKTPQNDLKIELIEKHHQNKDIRPVLKPLLEGTDMGLLSDAGSPAIADPGAEYVKFAHANGIRVIPLTGPSSIFLALAASGLNGQHFCFHGYLPIGKKERIDAIRKLEKESSYKQQTQIFIETPYRNNALLSDLLVTCQSSTLLCIAADITLPGEMIRTLNIGTWKKIPVELHKRPAVFLLLQP